MIFDYNTGLKLNIMKTIQTKVTGFPFVSHVDQSQRPEIDNIQDFIKKVFVERFGQLHDVMQTGYYKSMGYRYDLRPFMKSYLYKQHGQWTECYAPNKTLLRKAIHGFIDKIIEIN